MARQGSPTYPPASQERTPGAGIAGGGGSQAVGNDKERLLVVVTQFLPYIGYPRALSALPCVNEVAPESKR